MDNNAKKGILIEYKATSSHIYHQYMDTKPANTSKHVWFDKVMDYI